MTLTLTTTIDIPTIGRGIPVEVDYTYSTRYKELVISAVVAIIEGKQMPVWHLLGAAQRSKLEDECVDHWGDVKDAALESRWEDISGR